MSNDNNQLLNNNTVGPDQPASDLGSGGMNDVDTGVAKRSAVRQKLAIALMAVGGVLVVAVIWFTLYNRETIR